MRSLAGATAAEDVATDAGAGSGLLAYGKGLGRLAIGAGIAYGELKLLEMLHPPKWLGGKGGSLPHEAAKLLPFGHYNVGRRDVA